MTIKVGDRLPNVSVRLVTPDGPKPVETKDYFAGKKIVMFGLPGAFTPTCHKNHLPGFIVSEAAFKAKGIDAIAMTAVNDHYVLQAWSDATGSKGHIDFLADGRGDFARLWASSLMRPPGAWACALSAMRCWSRTGLSNS
jgi:peroxiredoxin